MGKAKNLKVRLRSYTKIEVLSPRIRQMVQEAVALRFQELPSELEAILTEAELIRTYQPNYNVLLKDDKSPLYIEITRESLPRVMQTRKKLLSAQPSQGVFGPFSSAYQVTQVLKIARSIFRWCDQPLSNKRCFYSHIHLCAGICWGQIPATDYLQNIEQLALFLRGKSDELLKQLKQAMKEASTHQNFEQAARYRDMITAVTAVTKIPYKMKPDPTALRLSDSSEADGVVYLQRLLHLHLRLPKQQTLTTIEGYDVSNTSGTNASVAQVVFTDGSPDKKKYRLFNIRSLTTPNDYHMLKEALIRRQQHAEWGVPDLVIIDGGKGQLRSVLSVWQWQAPVMSIAKNPDRLIFPKFEEGGKKNKVSFEVVRLEETHPALQLVQHVRDEAHRFSKNQHSRRRLKQMLANH